MKVPSLPGYVDRLIKLTGLFVQRKLERFPEFTAALIIGSVAHGEARADSDVDCVFVFECMDERLVPAEFIWSPTTDTYHTIFEVDASEVSGVHIDAKRVSAAQFFADEWTEGFKHDLASAIVVFDRNGTITPFLGKRLEYPDLLRSSRIHEHYGQANYYSEEWRLRAWVKRGGLLCAHDQLTAAFEEIIRLLHAYNKVWLPWRYRWLISAQRLPWLPDGFEKSMQMIQTNVALTEESLMQRQKAIAILLHVVGSRLQAEGLLANHGEVFQATHPELGYAHNMGAWSKGHQEFLRERGVGDIAYGVDEWRFFTA